MQDSPWHIYSSRCHIIGKMGQDMLWGRSLKEGRFDSYSLSRNGHDDAFICRTVETTNSGSSTNVKTAMTNKNITDQSGAIN